MLVDNKHYRSIWRDLNSNKVKIIDQKLLPHKFVIAELNNVQEARDAIKNMAVRGAPLIGITAAYGMALAMANNNTDKDIINAGNFLISSRPTAVNLAWAVTKVSKSLLDTTQSKRTNLAMTLADQMAEDDVETNEKIGIYGCEIIKQISEKKSDGNPVRILTHCNAGWLATVDIGTATAPIYQASKNNIAVSVWVDETRPRNQGAALTTWELKHNSVEHTLIVDNAGGHLMQKGLVDIVIVGSDRTSANGDVCNKIGTYLKALAAKHNDIPFYAALPTSTIDMNITNGVQNIPIEDREHREVTHINGVDQNGKLISVKICPPDTKISNPSFDVTPAELITGIITEKGILHPNKGTLLKI